MSGILATQNILCSSLNHLHKWFVRMLEAGPQQQLLVYHPHTDTRLCASHPARELCALWHAGLLGTVLDAKSLTESVLAPSIDYYLSFLEELPSSLHGRALAFSARHIKDPSISHNAFMMLALLAIQHPSDSQKRIELVRKLGNGILQQQLNASSAESPIGVLYRIHFNSSLPSSFIDPVQPAQAMLALAAAFTATKEENYLASIRLAFPAYRNLFNKGQVDAQNIVFASSWISQAFSLAYRAFADLNFKREILQFLFSLQSDVIDPEKLGFFEGLQLVAPPHFRHNYATIEVACALDGLVDVYALLVDVLPHAAKLWVQSGESFDAVQRRPGENLELSSAVRDDREPERPIDYNESNSPKPPQTLLLGNTANWNADSLEALKGKMEMAMTQAIEFLLQVQQAVPPSPRGLGGFGSSLVDPTQRVDIAGHITSAFSKLIHRRIELPELRVPSPPAS